MSPVLILLLALLIDAAMGEPRWLWDKLPHPAVLMGRAVGWLDARLNTGTARRAKGIAALVLLTGSAAWLGMALETLGAVVEIAVLAAVLAQRSLVDHVRAVADALRQSVPEARRAVSHIVGRDTRAMQGPDVARAAIESGAENFSDGVIAPVFWYLVAGLPGLLIYKITNTADSMIGYRTPRHAEFGWAAARFDDLLNVLPARLSALLLALAHGRLSDWPRIAAAARRHRSPNAGWPEAAMALSLDVALAGPRSYDGEMQPFAFVHPEGRREIGAAETEAACRALWRGWALMAAALALIAVVFG